VSASNDKLKNAVKSARLLFRPPLKSSSTDACDCKV
jgi:hypothetical protein